MRKLICGLALAATLVPGAAHAQMTLDMSRINCAEYLAMPADRSEIFSAWMSGWFNQRFANNKRALVRQCKKSGGELVMSAIRKTAR